MQAGHPGADNAWVTAMGDLWLYDRVARLLRLSYRTKIMVMAFVGTHIPLIALAAYFALRASSEWRDFIATMAVTLVATLTGTGVTLFVLNHLLRPVVATSATLRGYRQARDVGALPLHYTDEVGTLMADATATLVHLERVRDALEHLDGATGLPNRRKLGRDLGRRMAAGGRFAVCVMRFANYQRLVETLALGDAEAAAAEAAARVAAGLRDGETLYRVGGADFMFLSAIGDTDGLTAIGMRLQALIETCGRSLTVGAMDIEPRLYGAVAVFPDDAGSPDPLIDHAIGAVALAGPDSKVGYHSVAAREAATARLRLEQELRRALTGEEFVLHYQPIIDLSVGRPVGAEALIRWQRPGHGLVPPASFIGAAETTGLIDPIGLWVLRTACHQVKAWNGSGLPGMKVAINLSARQFLDPDLVRFVAEALGVSGIAADQLEIELTETAAMADHAYTRSVFGKLRDLGVSIAIDDFGTGYASMSYLRKLPFDKLKIDREFVTDVHRTRDSQAICGALVELGNGLGLNVLAEGAETEDEVRFLRSRGCDLYQGYYFSKPLAAADLRGGIGALTDLARRVGVKTAAAGSIPAMAEASLAH
jgi:EAL domain-containing protein (putative c-di-GMP-specific phosphodiesterase class I)